MVLVLELEQEELELELLILIAVPLFPPKKTQPSTIYMSSSTNTNTNSSTQKTPKLKIKLNLSSILRNQTGDAGGAGADANDDRSAVSTTDDLQPSTLVTNLNHSDMKRKKKEQFLVDDDDDIARTSTSTGTGTGLLNVNSSQKPLLQAQTGFDSSTGGNGNSEHEEDRDDDDDEDDEDDEDDLMTMESSTAEISAAEEEEEDSFGEQEQEQQLPITSTNTPVIRLTHNPNNRSSSVAASAAAGNSKSSRRGRPPSGSTKKPLFSSLVNSYNLLFKKDVYGIFVQPVDTSIVTDYLDVIKKPMDFSTIWKKIDSKQYNDILEYKSDVLLMFDNAMKYNAPSTIYHKQARKLYDYASKHIDRMIGKVLTKNQEIQLQNELSADQHQQQQPSQTRLGSLKSSRANARSLSSSLSNLPGAEIDARKRSRSSSREASVQPPDSPATVSGYRRKRKRKYVNKADLLPDELLYSGCLAYWTCAGRIALELDGSRNVPWLPWVYYVILDELNWPYSRVIPARARMSSSGVSNTIYGFIDGSGTDGTLLPPPSPPYTSNFQPNTPRNSRALPRSYLHYGPPNAVRPEHIVPFTMEVDQQKAFMSQLVFKDCSKKSDIEKWFSGVVYGDDMGEAYCDSLRNFIQGCELDQDKNENSERLNALVENQIAKLTCGLDWIACRIQQIAANANTTTASSSNVSDIGGGGTVRPEIFDAENSESSLVLIEDEELRSCLLFGKNKFKIYQLGKVVDALLLSGALGNEEDQKPPSQTSEGLGQVKSTQPNKYLSDHKMALRYDFSVLSAKPQWKVGQRSSDTAATLHNQGDLSSSNAGLNAPDIATRPSSPSLQKTNSLSNLIDQSSSEAKTVEEKFDALLGGISKSILMLIESLGSLEEKLDSSSHQIVLTEKESLRLQSIRNALFVLCKYIPVYTMYGGGGGGSIAHHAAQKNIK